jgi:DNA-3-methyladenine glycosylase
MKPLDPGFYDRPVLEVARDLIGCTVEHGQTSGVIVETEAYHEIEPACHAFIGLTPRTQPLFGPAGDAYVYRSYGIHALLNAVCEPEGVGAAVLIRAISPVRGIEQMRARREGAPGKALRRPLRDRDLCSGPGRLTQALGIGLDMNQTSLTNGPVRILPASGAWHGREVIASTRIGITKAIELPWRFSLVGDENVSRPWPWKPTAVDLAARTLS